MLAAAALGLALAAAEVGLRVHGHLRNRGTLHRALAAPVELPASGEATLGHMIRLSRHRRIIYELRPGLTVTFRGRPVTTNEHGFRGSAYPTAKPAGTYRVVGLGDSFMFGHGVADDETYLARLERLLEERSRGPRFEIVNTAVPGYNGVMEVETLKHKGLAFDPDLVVIHFVGNDFELPNFVRVVEPVLALDTLFLARIWKRAATRGESSFARQLRRYGLAPVPAGKAGPGRAADPDAVPPEYRSMVGLEAYREALHELARMGGEHPFDTLLLTFSLPRPRQRVLTLARDLGIATLDLGPTLDRWVRRNGYPSYRRSPLALSDANMHPSPLGHRLTAEALHAEICRRFLAADLAACEP